MVRVQYGPVWKQYPKGLTNRRALMALGTLMTVVGVAGFFIGTEKGDLYHLDIGQNIAYLVLGLVALLSGRNMDLQLEAHISRRGRRTAGRCGSSGLYRRGRRGRHLGDIFGDPVGEHNACVVRCFGLGHCHVPPPLPRLLLWDCGIRLEVGRT